MSQSWTEEEAKDYLAGKISSKAEREGMPLSELERNMLYFSEGDWAIPEKKAMREEFNRNYDLNEFREKISELVRQIQANVEDHGELEKKAWDDAVRRLSGRGHYLLSMMHSIHWSEEDAAASAQRDWDQQRDQDLKRNRVRGWFIAIVAVVVGLAIVAFLVL